MGTDKSVVENFHYERRTREKQEVGYQHYHNYFEIYFLEKGFCHYFIDNDTYDVQEGDVVIIPPGIIHKTMYGESSAIRRLIYCSPIYIPSSVIGYFSSMLYVYRNQAVTQSMQKIFNVIEKESESYDEFSEEALLHIMHLLFFFLARNHSTEPPRRIGSNYTTDVISFIKQNYSEDIRLSDLSAMCSVSDEHLSRIFKRDTGFCISEFLSIIRLQRAQVLISSKESLSIAEIAQKCGFCDSNYFSKKFKEMYGLSPLNFRKYSK